MVKSGLTLDEIKGWGGPEVFNQGLAMVNSGDVVSVEYDDNDVSISGKIAKPDGWEMPVSLKLKEKGRIESRCPCFQNQKLGQVCAHVVALGIAQTVLEMDDEPEEEERGGRGGSYGADTGEHAHRNPDGPAEPDFIEVPMQPKFYAYVSGSRASLSIAIDAWYGDIDFPACSLQSPNVVSLPDPDDSLVRRVRSMDAERAAVASAAK